MGKSDDLQRMREEQHARREREAERREAEAKRKPAPPLSPLAVAAAAPDVAVAAPVDAERPVRTKAAPVEAKAGSLQPAAEKAPRAPRRDKAIAAKPKAKPGAAAGEETGRCASCGKVKPLNRGLVSDHQKGLGKACAGSRKRPA